jgi:hypothetical protein
MVGLSRNCAMFKGFPRHDVSTTEVNFKQCWEGSTEF